ncbi:hypothetical protein FSEG_02197, partial [Fusobacterium necrophorum D12]
LRGKFFTRYSPVRHPSPKTRVDLHVLSILSAFILSQDQTLRSMFLSFTVLIFYTLFVLFACCLSYSLCEGPFRSCGHLVSYHTSYFPSTLFLKNNKNYRYNSKISSNSSTISSRSSLGSRISTSFPKLLKYSFALSFAASK